MDEAKGVTQFVVVMDYEGYGWANYDINHIKVRLGTRGLAAPPLTAPSLAGRNLCARSLLPRAAGQGLPDQHELGVLVRVEDRFALHPRAHARQDHVPRLVSRPPLPPPPPRPLARSPRSPRRRARSSEQVSDILSKVVPSKWIPRRYGGEDAFEYEYKDGVDLIVFDGAW
jgi:hypothetical protein